MARPRVRVCAERGRRRQGGRHGRGAKFRGQPGARGRPERGGGRPGSAASRGPRRPDCVRPRGPLGPTARHPHPGPGPAGDPGPSDARRRLLAAPRGGPAARPLFCSPPPGFRPSLGRRCGRKPPPTTLLESLNGKGAHLFRPGAARLILAICLSPLLRRRKKKMSVSWGGRVRGSCEPSLKTCPREGARFLGGSPVVLRGLRCHVCCDSALQFLKTFCRIECNLFSPSSFQTP